eukprot:IDg21162t1
MSVFICTMLAAAHPNSPRDPRAVFIIEEIISVSPFASNKRLVRENTRTSPAATAVELVAEFRTCIIESSGSTVVRFRPRNTISEAGRSAITYDSSESVQQIATASRIILHCTYSLPRMRLNCSLAAMAKKAPGQEAKLRPDVRRWTTDGNAEP